MLKFVFVFSLVLGGVVCGQEWDAIRPVLQQRCYECHGGKKTKGGVDLKKLDGDPKFTHEFELWNKVQKSVKSGDMPPEEKEELKPEEKERLTGWLGKSLEEVMRKNANDPGIVTMRRLTNAEYDRTLRDLIGVELGLSADFLPDGGGGEGFSNVGDILFMSPQQLDKYLTAARGAADHLTVLPGSGLLFQSARVGLRGSEQVRDQAEQALYVWYQKMVEPLLPKDEDDMREADYLMACWKFKFKEQTGVQSLAEVAKAEGLSPVFLENWWALVNNDRNKSRFLDLTRVRWRELPGPEAGKPTEVPAGVREKCEEIAADQKSWLGPKGRRGDGVQRMQQDADGIKPWPVQCPVKGAKEVFLVVGDCGDGAKGDLVLFADLTLERGKAGKVRYFDWLSGRKRDDVAALAKPETAEADKPKLEAKIKEADEVLGLFGKHPGGLAIEPSTIAVQAPKAVRLPLPEDATFMRGGGQLDLRPEDAQYATVQFQLKTAPAWDPTKIIPGVITIWKRQSTASFETMRDFSLMRTAFPDEYARRLEEVARNYNRGGKGIGVYYFSDDQLKTVISPEEQRHMAAMLEDWRVLRMPKLPPKEGEMWDGHLQEHLERFAEQAWRRPLAPEEKDQLHTIYTEARGRELDRETAAREVVVRTLISPNFLFKLEDAEQPGEHRLGPWELASRLSYFLWSSMPDEELRTAAGDGSLLKPEVLQKEVKRMLKDPRAEGLAEEFAGQWLEFSGFAHHGTVDATKFPEFTPELRQDMYGETVAFLAHIIREDLPISELLTANYTFLNERLAAHYGVPGVTGPEFRKVEVAQFHRGGLLGMGSILTKTSYPLRTSPVLRGNWLLRSVLGTPTPPPPANVPQLDENAAHPTTLRARLEAHRADAACAVCHDRIDPLGFALEEFDPIGRLRTKDDAGLQIDDSAEMKDGTKFEGLTGLRQFLVKHEGEFDALLCRKLVGFALGRSILLTDQPLLEQMKQRLAQQQGRFSAVAVTVAESRQFQNRRNE